MPLVTDRQLMQSLSCFYSWGYGWYGQKTCQDKLRKLNVIAVFEQSFQAVAK